MGQCGAMWGNAEQYSAMWGNAGQYIVPVHHLKSNNGYNKRQQNRSLEGCALRAGTALKRENQNPTTAPLSGQFG